MEELSLRNSVTEEGNTGGRKVWKRQIKENSVVFPCAQFHSVSCSQLKSRNIWKIPEITF
jgi:hypothetical protein